MNFLLDIKHKYTLAKILTLLNYGCYAPLKEDFKYEYFTFFHKSQRKPLTTKEILVDFNGFFKKVLKQFKCDRHRFQNYFKTYLPQHDDYVKLKELLKNYDIFLDE